MTDGVRESPRCLMHCSIEEECNFLNGDGILLFSLIIIIIGVVVVDDVVVKDDVVVDDVDVDVFEKVFSFSLNVIC